MEAFKRITAPFDGIVTSRTTDIGALISVGSPSQTPLFTVDDEHRLRIYVSVPQDYSADIKPGMTAQLHRARISRPEFSPRRSPPPPAPSTPTTARCWCSFRRIMPRTDCSPAIMRRFKFNLPGDAGGAHPCPPAR